MARELLNSRAGIMAFLAASLLVFGSAGCIIPPPLDVDTSDGGGANRPPLLRWDVIYPPLLKPLTVRQTGQGKVPVKQAFSIAFVEKDRQVVSVRFFIKKNYKSAIVDLKSPQPQDEFNGVWVEISGLCDALVNNIVDNYDLEVYISDSGFVEKGDDLRVIGPGGYRDNAFWTLVCEPPES